MRKQGDKMNKKQLFIALALLGASAGVGATLMQTLLPKQHGVISNAEQSMQLNTYANGVGGNAPCKGRVMGNWCDLGRGQGYQISSQTAQAPYPQAQNLQNSDQAMLSMPDDYDAHDDAINQNASNYHAPSYSAPHYNAMPIENQSSQLDSLRTCAYHDGAARVGIKHYKFTEAHSDELVQIPARYRDGGGQNSLIHKDALQPLISMIEASGGLLKVGSSFRSVQYQAGIVSRKRNSGQSDTKIYKASAPAGHSEHHTGFAVDFTPISASFANTKAYAWLKANAHKYGFVQTFTPEYSAKTGVMVEAWHWKYVGSETAKIYTANAACALGR